MDDMFIITHSTWGYLARLDPIAKWTTNPNGALRLDEQTAWQARGERWPGNDMVSVKPASSLPGGAPSPTTPTTTPKTEPLWGV